MQIIQIRGKTIAKVFGKVDMFTTYHPTRVTAGCTRCGITRRCSSRCPSCTVPTLTAAARAADRVRAADRYTSTQTQHQPQLALLSHLCSTMLFFSLLALN